MTRVHASVFLPALAVSLGFFFEYLLLTCFGCPPRVLFLASLVLWPVGGALYYLTRRHVTSERRVYAPLVGALVAAYVLPLCHPGLPPAGAAELAWAHAWDSYTGLLPALSAVPLLVASGFTEMAIYDRRVGRGLGFHTVYGLLLAGTAGGLPLGYVLNQTLGLTSIVVLGTLVALAAAFAATGRGVGRRGAAVAAAALAVAVVSDVAWLHKALAINRHGQEFEQQGYRRVYEKWGRFGLFTVRVKEDAQGGLGFYNDILHWGFRLPKFEDPGIVDALPFAVGDPRARVAIIGAGGGRQIGMALARGFERVKAIELEPAVVEYWTRIDPDRNGRVYLDPRVEVVAGEGRATVEADPGPFGLVYIADTGAARWNFLNLLNDASFLHTVEALRGFASRLGPGGFVASYMQRGVDPRLLMRPHLEESFRQAGLVTWTVNDDEGFTIFGAPPAWAEEVKERARTAIEALRPDMLPWREGREADPPRALMAGHDTWTHSQFLFVLTLEDARALFGRLLGGTAAGVAGFLACLGGVAALGRWRAGAPAGPRFLWARAGAVGVLVGFNFAVLQIYVVEVLNAAFHEIFLTTLAGSIGFLGTAALGSIVLGAARRRAATALLAAAALLVALVPPPGWLGLRLVALALLTLGTGALFPSIARPELRWLVVLFASDALGAFLGSVVALGFPPLYGLGRFGLVATAGFVVAWLARNRLLAAWEAAPPAPPAAATGAGTERAAA